MEELVTYRTISPVNNPSPPEEEMSLKFCGFGEIGLCVPQRNFGPEPNPVGGANNTTQPTTPIETYGVILGNAMSPLQLDFVPYNR